MKCLDAIKCAVRTLIFVYPFFAVVNHRNEPADFEPCDGKCVFIQFFSTCEKHIPPTFAEDVESVTPAKEEQELQRENPVFPLYVSVQNGNKELHAKAPGLHFWEWLPYLYSWYPAIFSHIFVWQHPNDVPILQSPEMCTNSSSTEPHHHLEHGTSMHVYMVSLIFWTSLCILHDVALLYDYPEKLTLSIGIAAFACQIVACTAAFLWASSAVKVFVSEGLVTCYFRLGNLSLLASLKMISEKSGWIKHD